MKKQIVNYLYRVVRQEQQGLLAALVRGLLFLLSLVYRGLTSLRNWLYDRGLLQAGEVDTPLISIGNLTVGGTGKTPAVEALAQSWRDQGKQVVVLSRGYQGENEKPLLVSAGAQTLVGPNRAGDEAYMLAEKLTDVPVVICKSRMAAARYARAKFDPDLFVLDDGFQHRQIKRDFDLVLIDGTNPFGYGHLIPRGTLRESKAGLRRADGVVITRAGEIDQEQLNHLRNEISKYSQPDFIYHSNHKPVYLQDTAGVKLELRELEGSRIVAFSAIGNPKSFALTLEKLGAQIIRHFKFPDHHRYERRDMRKIINQKEQADIDYVVTTSKDLVKLDREILDLLTGKQIRPYSLEIELEFIDRKGEQKNLAVEISARLAGTGDRGGDQDGSNSNNTSSV